jgi:hypothetical protein
MVHASVSLYGIIQCYVERWDSIMWFGFPLSGFAHFRCPSHSHFIRYSRHVLSRACRTNCARSLSPPRKNPLETIKFGFLSYLACGADQTARAGEKPSRKQPSERCPPLFDMLHNITPNYCGYVATRLRLSEKALIPSVLSPLWRIGRLHSIPRDGDDTTSTRFR